MDYRPKIGLTIEFKDIFPDEEPLAIMDYLRGISQKKVLLIGSYFLGHKNFESKFSDLTVLLNAWFSKENHDFANHIYKKCVEHQKKHNSTIQIINPFTSLKIFELACENLTEEETQSNQELERNLFKAYIIQTETVNNKDKNILGSLAGKPDNLKIPLLFLTQSFRYSDIINNALGTIYVTEFIRAIIFFEFLESKDEAKSLLNTFYNEFQVTDWKDYLKRITGVTLPLIKEREEGLLDITVEGEDDQEIKKTSNIIEHLILNDFNQVEEFDFKVIRGKPFLKLSNDKYRVIYGQFAVETIHQGLYFLLAELNKSLEEKDRIDNFRFFYTYEYSEQFALYWILKSIYKSKYIQISGKDFESNRHDGGPDYYIRNGNKIFLFESKDVLIAADIKESVEYQRYEDALRSKFYFDEHNGKKKKKAILQLIDNIKSLLGQNFKSDNNYKVKSIKIYPILLVHNKIFNLHGLNKLLRYWFQLELERLQKDGFDVKNVRDIILVDIGTLIYYHDLFKNKMIEMDKIIDKYIKYTDLNNKPAPKNEDELDSNVLETLFPFSTFLTNYVYEKNIHKVTSLFLEKGFELASD